MRYASLFLALSALPAVAAEPQSSAPADWSGFYIGGHGGAAWGSHDATILPDIFILPAGSTIQGSVNGLLGGGQVGFNFQRGPWLFGVEGAVSWTDLDGAGHRDSNVIPGFTVRTATEIKWIAAATGRLGYGLDRTLLYVKGGVAQMEFHFEGFSEFNNVYQGGSEETGRRTGWTVGAGVEYAISPRWSMQLEYNLYDFGSKVYLVGGDTPVRLEPQFHSAQMALNYRFNLP